VLTGVDAPRGMVQVSLVLEDVMSAGHTVAITPSDAHVEVRLGGELLATTDHALRLDLCQAHFDELTGASRRLRPRRRTSAARSTTKAANKAAAAKPRRRGRGARDTAAVRAWARANGLTVSDRGRIPGPVLEAFSARA